MRGKLAKKLRKEVEKMQYTLAADLKGWIKALSLRKRLSLAFKIIFRKEW